MSIFQSRSIFKQYIYYINNSININISLCNYIYIYMFDVFFPTPRSSYCISFTVEVDEISYHRMRSVPRLTGGFILKPFSCAKWAAAFLQIHFDCGQYSFKELRTKSDCRKESIHSSKHRSSEQ